MQGYYERPITTDGRVAQSVGEQKTDREGLWINRCYGVGLDCYSVVVQKLGDRYVTRKLSLPKVSGSRYCS